MTQLKEDIFRLRAEGKTYKEIQEQLGCSKGTISYHLGEGQREKTYARTVKRREGPAAQKVECFKKERSRGKVRQARAVENPEEVIRNKVSDFQRRRGVPNEKNFTVSEFLAEFGDVDTCYLTGRPVDINDPKSYQLDHIVPVSGGGTNSIENCGVATPEANCGKGKQTLEEFLDMCYDVLVHWEVIQEGP